MGRQPRAAHGPCVPSARFADDPAGLQTVLNLTDEWPGTVFELFDAAETIAD